MSYFGKKIIYIYIYIYICIQFSYTIIQGGENVWKPLEISQGK